MARLVLLMLCLRVCFARSNVLLPTLTYAGAAALIQSVQQLGLPVGVASSGAPSKIQHNLSSSGLAALLPDQRLIVSAAEVRCGKPAPDVYLEVLRRMGCEDASRALVVEDAVHGLVAAKAAGASDLHLLRKAGSPFQCDGYV
eukprot:GHRQ01037191.1.p1 GENE.GHRQ01037191.1~~GHRQ01037191.1.p1  ORF type:complete len:143 (-),score=26.54 GHRQ01037191.1:419-847(-)